MTSLPHSTEAEKGLIACLVASEDRALFDQCLEMGITGETWFDRRHRIIWSAICRSHDSGELPDEMTVISRLEGQTVGQTKWLDACDLPPQKTLLEAVGGAAFILQLQDGVETHLKARQWMQAVVEKWRLRGLVEMATRTAQAAATPGERTAEDIAADLKERVNQLELKGLASSSLVTILNERRFVGDEDLEPPRTLISVNGIPVLTNGNLAAISGQVKTGKSAFIEAHLAAAMCSDPFAIDSLGVGMACHRKAVIHFDTEQSLFDHRMMIRRAMKRAGCSRKPPWLYTFALAGIHYQTIMRLLEFQLKRAADECSGIHAVLIDGVADLVSSPNNEEESFSLVCRLHGLAMEYDCGIVNVLHENPPAQGKGEGKTRGHLGSHLERKAESNLKLTRTGDLIRVTSQKQRKAPITKENGPAYRWCNLAGMHVSVDPEAAERLAKGNKADQLHAELRRLGHDDLSVQCPNALLEQAASAVGIGLRQARTYLNQLKDRYLGGQCSA